MSETCSRCGSQDVRAMAIPPAFDWCPFWLQCQDCLRMWRDRWMYERECA